MRSSVIGLVTQIILIWRNSNGFKTPLPLLLILLPLQLKCKAAQKMQHCIKDKHQTHPLFDALISFVVESTNAASNVAKKVLK